MSWRRNTGLGLVAAGLAGGGFMLAHGLAHARQNAVVVERFMLGYLDGSGRFVPTAGRGATNVDRNAVILFQFSGPIDMGPNLRASLPLTLAEQAELRHQEATDPDFDPEQSAFENGVTPRRLSNSQGPERGAFFVATGTVSPETVEIAAPTAGGSEAQAPGQFFKMLRGVNGKQVIPNRLLFNPRYTVATYNKPAEVDFNPEGLEGNTLHRVSIDGGSLPENPLVLLRNLDGEPLAVRFDTTFTTTNRYVQDYTRPGIRTTTPTDGTINVEADADIELTFSEPMDPASFVTPRFQGDDAWTVNVRYTQNALNGLLQNNNILIQPRVKPQTGGNVIQLRPLQGFGKGPFEIEVVVRNGVTDLSGNNIIRQIQYSFRTLFDSTADSAGFVTETFANTTGQDTSFNTPTGDNLIATWNATATPGLLTNTIQSVQFIVRGPASNSSVNLWGVAAIHFQNLYQRTDMSARARTITGFDWALGQNIGYSYPNTTIYMGHAAENIESLGFPGNATTAPGPLGTNFRDSILVVPATLYTTIGQTVGAYVRGPQFAQNFNYNGANAVILDVSHGGSGATPPPPPLMLQQDRWQADVNYTLQTTTFTNFTTNVTQAQRWYFQTRYTFLTPGAEAQSKFYDLTRNDARVLPQQIVPRTPPQGTSVTFVWQGAKDTLGAPGTPDLATLTLWVSDVRQLSNYRFIRFRATLLNNLTTLTVPSVDTLTIPYAYK